MRARLLLNLGLVLEYQKNIDGALNMIMQAELLCKKHNDLSEDSYRINISLAGLYDRQGNIESAIKKFNDAAKCSDDQLRAEAKLLKAEYLLKLGEWSEAKDILRGLYRNKKITQTLKEQVSKTLRIGNNSITACLKSF